MPVRAFALCSLAALTALPVPGRTAPAAPFAESGGVMSAAHASPQTRWWNVFADSGLDRLMTRLESDNTTIAVAAARLSAARAHAALGRAQTGPRLGLSVSGNYAAGPLINAAGGSGALFTGALNGSWEPDLLGRLAPSRRADKAEIRAAEADGAAIRLLAEVHTARAWYAAIALGKARTHALDVLELERESQTIAQARFARGLCSRQLVEDRAAEAARAEDRLSELTRLEIEARDALGYLVGDRTAIAPLTSHLPLPRPVPADLGAGLIERRPDVAAAMARAEAADARHSAARRDWLPQFRLTATGGTASTDLSGLLAGGVGSFGLGLIAALPGLDGGAHKARVARADAARQLADVQLRDTLLVAYRETSDALAGIARARSTLANERSRGEIAQAEAERAKREAERGSLSRSALNDAKIVLLEANIASALRQFNSIDADLTLLIALGGYWNT